MIDEACQVFVPRWYPCRSFYSLHTHLPSPTSLHSLFVTQRRCQRAAADSFRLQVRLLVPSAIATVVYCSCFVFTYSCPIISYICGPVSDPSQPAMTLEPCMYIDILFYHSSNYVQVIAAKETGTQAPVKRIENCSFLYTRHLNMYFVALTRSNVNPALVFEYLFQKIRILKAYLGEEFDENSMRNNMTLIYELMDETMDFGYPSELCRRRPPPLH